MSNLQLILSFMSAHPILSILIVWSVFSWTPIKVIHNHNDKDNRDEN